MLFPANADQKKGTDSIVVGLFSMFRAATLPGGRNKTKSS